MGVDEWIVSLIKAKFFISTPLTKAESRDSGTRYLL